ncbi:hypothetical protein PS3A_18820 [Pseudomonas sp. 3A(2025)]
MSTQTLQRLLAWMGDPDTNVMWGWDAIVALARSPLNRTLARDYLARLGTERQWPAFSGEIMTIDEQFKQVLHGWVLDAPELSFQGSAINGQRARLQVPVIAGQQIGLRKQVDTWQVVSLAGFDPLLGPGLALDLHLEQLSATVGDSLHVSLDFQHSDNWQLDFAPTSSERAKGGAFFQTQFERLLTSAQRQFNLALIEPGENPLLRPQSLQLRAQSRDAQDAEGADGALLVFVSMAGNEEGAGIDSTFRYLIPDDEPLDCSATVILGQRSASEALQPGTLLAACAEMIGSTDFACTHDADGVLQSAVAQAGALTVEPRPATWPTFTYEAQPLTVTLDSPALKLAANSSEPLTIDYLADGRVTVEWTTEQYVATTLRFSSPSGADYPAFAVNERCALHLSASYKPATADADTLTLEHWRVYVGPQARPATEQATFYFESDMARWAWQAFAGYVSSRLVALLQPAVDSAVRSRLKQDFKVHTSTAAQASELFTLGFGQVLHADTVARPRDLAVFGHIDSLPGTFVLEPAQVLIKAGASQAFNVLPAVQGLAWTVEALPPGAGDPGCISLAGVYQAPVAEAIEGPFIRVRVTASQAGRAFQASAQVTVLRESLTVNPLIQVCELDEQVELRAGGLDPGRLEWSIRNPVDGQSGRLTVHDDKGRTCTYTSTAQTVPGQTYVLDEILLRDSDGASRSVHVLVVLDLPRLSLSVAPDAALAAGQIQLQAHVNGTSPQGVQWHLPLGGPGELDADTGVYSIDSSATQPFLLVMARVEIEAVNLVLEGHLLLPLPFADLAVIR